jgi:hypothetical protein
MMGCTRNTRATKNPKVTASAQRDQYWNGVISVIGPAIYRFFFFFPKSAKV